MTRATTAAERDELIAALDAASVALSRLSKALHSVPLPKMQQWCTTTIPLCYGRSVGNGCTCDERRDLSLSRDLRDLASAVIARLGKE